MNYEQDSSIDPDALDVEWIKQSNLMFKYAKEEAAAKKRFQEAWEKVKVLKAQLTKQCKEENPKATGPMIEAFYRDHPEHKAAKQAMIDAEYEYGLCSAASKAIYQKKSALENLVRLLGMEYFSSPCDPRNLAEELKNKINPRKRMRRSKNGKKK